MTNAGNRPILKIYPGTGHFIHTDNPVEYPVDVVDFVTKGTVDTSSPLGTDRMIHGARGIRAARGTHTGWAVADGRPQQVGVACRWCVPAKSSIGWREWGEGRRHRRSSSTAISPARTGSNSLHRCFRVASGDRDRLAWCGESDRPTPAPNYATIQCNSTRSICWPRSMR